MTLTTLLRYQPPAETFPVLDMAPKDSIIIRTPGENVRLERSVVDSHTSVLGGPGETQWRTPGDCLGLRACVINGYPRRGPLSYEYLYLRDKQILDRGFIADAVLDYAAGWAEFTGASNLAQLQHIVVGELLTNLLPADMTSGYTANNVHVTGGASISFGAGVTLKEGPDRESEWRSIHANVDTGTSDLDRSFYGSVWMNWNGGGRYPPWVLVTRYDPNKHATDPSRVTEQTQAALPDPLPKNKWVRIEFPTVTIRQGAVDDQIQLDLGTTWGGGSVQYCGARMVADPGLTVPPGASSSDMVAALINHGAALQGINMRAVVLSASAHVFPDDGTGVGFRYPFIDHANVWSSVQSYAAEVDLLYDPASDIVYVGGLNTFGRRHTEIVFSSSTTGSGGKVLKSDAPSDKMLTDEIMQDPSGSESREEVDVATGSVVPWRDVGQAYDGTYPIGLAGQAQSRVDTLSDYTQLQDTVVFPNAPEGIAPDQWLMDVDGRAGWRPGDWAAVRTDLGPFHTSTWKRIAQLTSKPSASRTLEATGVG